MRLRDSRLQFKLDLKIKIFNMFQEIMKYYQSKTATVYKIKTGHYESKTNECIKEK